MINLDKLHFNHRGLIPAIVVDATSGDVLTLAYMNRESLQVSINRKLTCFYSRSRHELWLKGETSGNYQHIVSITADCDYDALVVKVNKEGPACHSGNDSCFFHPVFAADPNEMKKAEPPKTQVFKPDFSFDRLYALLQGRKETLPEGSYTSYLFKKGIDKILKKVGEECTEVIIAGKADDKAETIYEVADLAYHVMVMMTEMGITPDDIRKELADRHIIDHKVKQEKMTG
ncbi:MAG: bifunctional phosphoribosyl-AMP cyclohydrolase/phosphoribosyl-ATP diphosphatase HisIE, partial [Clostridia bacterium]|nr:bifunctional phosphoribosyl-AMP cyclohydrolase/phosphoribosyl-ATP diphosphatase HisIE [Clostridia bacterium]